MSVGEIVVCILWLAAALYGCTQLVRRLCLLFGRCPGCAAVWRVAVPKDGIAIEPLLQSLESRAAWDDPEEIRGTVLLVKNKDGLSADAQAALEKTPWVTAVTAAELPGFLEAG